MEVLQAGTFQNEASVRGLGYPLGPFKQKPDQLRRVPLGQARSNDQAPQFDFSVGVGSASVVLGFLRRASVGQLLLFCELTQEGAGAGNPVGEFRFRGHGQVPVATHQR